MRASRLFDEPSLRKLEQLTLNAGNVRVGVMKGDRHSRKRGTSIEFADYRNYTQGDDLRRLDWNIYARLDRPFIKVTEEEEDLAVHILVDTSSSMDWPPDTTNAVDAHESDDNKLRYALRLAGGLGTIGLAGGDLMTLTLFDSEGQRPWGAFRGRPNTWPMLQFLESSYNALQQHGETRSRTTDIEQSLRDYARRARRPGLLLLVTDLLSPGDYRNGLHALQARGYDLVLLQVLSPDEVDPRVTGDLRLIDVETGAAAEVSIDPLMIELYSERLAAWQTGIRNHCTSRGMQFVPLDTNIPWDAAITLTLRQQGVIR